jgi:2-dehydro-3-deoxygluconokinase
MIGRRPYAVTFGETMGLLSTATPASLAHISTLSLGVGGAESNVAIGLQRMGANAVWIGRVGPDSLGERVLREIRAEGVEVHSRVDPHALTGVMFKERRTADTARVWYYRDRSAGSRLSSADIPEDLIAGASLLHITGITPGLSDSAAEATSASVAVARANGVPVSFDVNHRAGVWRDRDAASAYVALAKCSSIVFAGADEARLLAPDAATVSDLATAIAELGPDQVVIKLGANGCLARVAGGEHRQPAVPITAVDTVGAGDAFVAGYLAEHIAGATPQQRLLTAVTTAAFACLSAADWEGFPRRHELGLLNSTEPVLR